MSIIYLGDRILDWQNWEKSEYVYEREADCTDCRKDMLIMSFRFKVGDELKYDFRLIGDSNHLVKVYISHRGRQ